jgi:hypothetical protein
MSKVAEKKPAAKAADKSPIKQEITELSEQIAAVMTMDKKTGVCTVPDGIYVKLLPAGITEEIVKDVQTYNSNFATAAALTVGEAAIPVMKKDKELLNASLEIKTVGKDTIGVSFDRSRQVPSRDENNQPNGTKTKFGSTSVEIVSYGAKTRGQLKLVKEMLAEKAFASFGK